MKKYSIHNLYVVKLKDDDESYYLICKHNEIDNTYVEIFTNEKIKVTDNSSIESLIHYYSILARRNYKTGKWLRVDKRQLLRKYIEINQKVSEEELEEPREYSKLNHTESNPQEEQHLKERDKTRIRERLLKHDNGKN